MTEEQDREKLVRYQILQQRIQVLDSRRNFILNRLIEVDNTLSSLDELKQQKNKDIFLPLGSGIHAKGSLKDVDNMIVMIGADVAVDMSFDKTKRTLEDNKKVLENGLKTIEDEMIKSTEELMDLEPQVQEIVQRRK